MLEVWCSFSYIFVVLLRWNAQEGLGRPMPEVPSEYLQRCLFIQGMHSMPSWQQIARGLHLAGQLHLWRWSSGQFEWKLEPCLASALSAWKKACLAMFPTKLFDFSRVVKLWSVQKSCIEAEPLTFGFILGLKIWSKGSAAVQRTKPSPRTFAWSATSFSSTAQDLERKSAPPVPCQITRAWALAERINAWRLQADAMPTCPTLWAKSRGYPMKAFVVNSDVSMFWCFMDSLEHLHTFTVLNVILVQTTIKWYWMVLVCDLWY